MYNRTTELRVNFSRSSAEQGLSVMIKGTSIWYWNPETTIHHFIEKKLLTYVQKFEQL